MTVGVEAAVVMDAVRVPVTDEVRPHPRPFLVEISMALPHVRFPLLPRADVQALLECVLRHNLMGNGHRRQP